MKPGEIIVKKTEVVINEGHTDTTIHVKNTGDRPIQVGSHYHFFEANNALEFDREKAYGKHLDIPAGAAVRFEPGDEKDIQLIEYSGNRKIYGFQGKVDGPIDEDRVYVGDNKMHMSAEEAAEENVNKKH
ncbi:urease subunit beta [Staphylococcus massiliensis]|uniref:urease subunit beta n=1 Tax=Staphylococcus massiliensis TaxID=555791 RepID=UPI001EDD73E0|nr:urease subunit beta [Staphylococcus massiliensis]MCG3402327.1 urease subunit beta [Staphylococcus massiliensis]MCG3411705.1 urease subunit beta [Staphylococcus massiliensis]